MRLNTLNPLNRNWRPNNGIVMRLLTLQHNSGGRQWFDIAGGNHGTLANGATWLSMRRDNSFGCVNFDGTNDYVDLGAVTLLADNVPFTLSWWENAQVSSGYQSRFRLAVGANSFGVLRTDQPTYDGLCFGKWTAVNSVKAKATSVAGSLRLWKHFVLVSLAGPNSTTASNWKVYENGVSKTISAGGSFNTQPAANQIGHDSIDDGAGAMMDDTCLWNRALTLADAQAIYHDSRTGYPKSLNWIKPRVVTPAVASTNRIRRLITAGGS